MAAVTAAIVGPGNIGTDLMIKLQRIPTIDVRYMVGVDPRSDGLKRAQKAGLEVSADGVDWLLNRPEPPQLVFEATSARAHQINAPRYAEAGMTAIDLTPAAIGPYICPAVNLDVDSEHKNVNMITCGGQATIPIVHAISRVTPVSYAEIVASISSRSAGPGTRASIDEFTETTSRAVARVGGADAGKAIVIINPVEPPLIMRDTVFAAIDGDADREAITASIHRMVETVQAYVLGYELVSEPQFDDPQPGWNGKARVAVFLRVAGNGDYLPPYAGNLDIMTAAAARVGELLATPELTSPAR